MILPNRGSLKILLLHRQAVLLRIGGKVGGIVTWADVLNIRKTKAGKRAKARHRVQGGIRNAATAVVEFYGGSLRIVKEFFWCF